MPGIELLDKQTIDKIAAGEVIERPSSVVKELVENAIDANATAITVEIKEGGISFIRITDNGCGIAKEEVQTAFLRHSTSKIRSIEDLNSIVSLGFRGEALSSIAAVSQVELITKTPSELTGVRFLIEDGLPGALEEIGAPDGTTFLVRNLFFHTPARKKFLKTPQTEAGYISALVEKLALSHPDISFQLIVNQQPKLHTPGNHRLKDVIYQIYGRDITANLIEIRQKNELFEVNGFIGKPIVARGNRNFENYFVNGRYIKSKLLSKAIEDGYKLHLMQHQYPFTVLHFSFHGEEVDVNVHPTKMELRFSENERIYQFLHDIVKQSLEEKELIPEISLEKEEKPLEKGSRQKPLYDRTEPFEAQRMKRLGKVKEYVAKDSPYSRQYEPERTVVQEAMAEKPKEAIIREAMTEKPKEPVVREARMEKLKEPAVREAGMEKPKEPMVQKTAENSEKYMVQETMNYEQENLFAGRSDTLDGQTGGLLKENMADRIHMIGQLFDTYWLMEYENRLYILDQHAAHEKVLFERTMKALADKEHFSQMVSPPIILTLTDQEQGLLTKYMQDFTSLGFEISQFGGKEYAVSAVPQNLFHLNQQSLFLEILDNLSGLSDRSTPQTVLEKIASMSCKAAVKGNQKLSLPEAKSLIAELMELDNPYQCPHGRPTLITMSKYELEKKFKRIV
ncbi:MAG: DNA mismatch repair endonuclease MutL [Eubacterium sp.]|nr:DNA mismatch repair endonuclease MutL [Eubacterium sp.]